METLEEKSDLLGLQTENNMEQPFTVSSLVCITKKCFNGLALFQIGNNSRGLFSSVGCQLQGSLPAFCLFLAHSASWFCWNLFYFYICALWGFSLFW